MTVAIFEVGERSVRHPSNEQKAKPLPIVHPEVTEGMFGIHAQTIKRLPLSHNKSMSLNDFPGLK